jgi:hypothetical protein
LSPEVLLAGSLGALAVFFGLGVLRDFVQRRHERRGLSRLVRIEIVLNEPILARFYENPKLSLTDAVNGLSVDTWESARVRLADMIPDLEFVAMAHYYMYLQKLRDLSTAYHQYHSPEGEAVELLHDLKAYERVASRITLHYANKKFRIPLRTLLYKYRVKSEEERS